jgi:ribosomal-protein-alanine N-acetyltransferase
MTHSEVRIATERLLLRDFQSTDLAAVHAYASNEQVVAHQAWGPNTLEQTRQFVELCAGEAAAPNRTVFNLAVVLHDGRLAGCCMGAIGGGGHEAEIGYSFEPSFWGHGYALEAVQALIGYLFAQHRVQRIFATCGPQNAASIRLLRKAGFALEGRLRAHKVVRGQLRDSLVWARLADALAGAPVDASRRLLDHIASQPLLAMLDELTGGTDKSGEELLRMALPLLGGPVPVTWQQLSSRLGAGWRDAVAGWRALADALATTQPATIVQVQALVREHAGMAGMPQDAFARQAALALFGTASDLDLGAGLLAIGPRDAARRLRSVASAFESMQLVS